MANSFYNRASAFLARTKAKSDDVRSELDAISAGFDQFPTPIGDGTGFSDPVKVGTATDPAHALTKGVYDAQIGENASNLNGAVLAQQAAELAKQQAETTKLQTETIKTYASDWAIKAENTPVTIAAGGNGVSTFSAYHWAAKAASSAAAAQGSAEAAALFDPSSYVVGDAIIYVQWSVDSIYITQAMTGTITNYDSMTSYNVSAVLGTVSISGDTIAYTAPAAAGTETITLNGRSLSFPIQPAGITTPTPLSPTNGAIDQGGSVDLVASTYATAPTGFEAHTSSDWQVSTDAGFTTIIAQSLSDATNLESWTVSGLVESTLYYWRVRYKSASLTSAWMTAAQFTTSATFGGIIGTAGQQGFGAGVYPNNDLSTLNLTVMTGTTDPAHDNYGNYQHSNGSILVFVPKFYYRVGNATAPQYATYGANSIEIAGIDQFSNTASANTAGYALHRAFIDGGAEKSGFFIDKYLLSKDGLGNAVSVKNGIPISLTTTTTYTNSLSLSGCTGILADSITMCRARGTGYNQSSAFMFGALTILSVAHGQLATGTAACAWYDASGTTNFPKGCNNNALGDTNDAGVSFTTAGDAGNANKPRAGSGVPFAKTTHNGQNCGVADLNGSLYDCALGITSPGSSATSTTALTNDTIYVMKESTALASLTAGWDGAMDAFGNTAHLSTIYDSVTSPHALGSTPGTVYWGNGSNQVIDGANIGVAWSTAGFIPKNNVSTSASGTNQFGNDYLYRYNTHNMFPLVGGAWASAAYAGVFCRVFDSFRSSGYNNAAARASAYLQ